MTPSWRAGREAADPPRTPVLFVNPRSGGGAAARARVAERAREQGIEVVELGGDQDLRSLVDQAWPAARMRSGWPVATALSRSSLPPLPRTNCLSSAYPRERATTSLETSVWIPAIRPGAGAFGDGVEGRIDLGEVNGRSFLNLVSWAFTARPSGGRVPRCEGTHAARHRSRRSRSESSGAELNLVDDLGEGTPIP
jgi:hypothetical protein